MSGFRVFLGWISVILVAVGLVAGLHEMTWYYTDPVDQMEYVLGSMIGMLVYVAMIWGIYGFGCLIWKLRKGRQGRKRVWTEKSSLSS